MSSMPAAVERPLSLFRPPYDQLVPCSAATIKELRTVNDWKGCALIWQLAADRDELKHYDALRHKPQGLPLLVLLPPPAQIGSVLDMLPLIRGLAPRIILPFGMLESPFRLRQVLALGPQSIATSLTEYLARRGLLTTRKGMREFHRIMELAPETSSIATLARRMYTSRRTLGRHFAATNMPVPSHCLHFGRLLNVALRLQQDEGTVFRVASRFGYPDGFTMSNQMKRLTGYRPSEVRELLGWEWIVEAWLRVEGIS